MPTVGELSSPYANFMLAPRLGPGVCRRCFNLTEGYARCFACEHGGDSLDVVAPIAYSVGGEQLHHALAAYKRAPGEAAETLTRELAAVLWRHLVGHERCLARAAGADAFPYVTSVPSGRADRRGLHPLQRIVSELVGATRERFRPLLERTELPVRLHRFSPDRFAATRPLEGEPVLLIDDTWTTGASAQSAAATLKKAGAGPIAAVVIGRYVNRGWGENDRRLRALPAPFDWSCCPYCPDHRVSDFADPSNKIAHVPDAARNGRDEPPAHGPGPNLNDQRADSERLTATTFRAPAASSPTRSAPPPRR